MWWWTGWVTLRRLLSTCWTTDGCFSRRWSRSSSSLTIYRCRPRQWLWCCSSIWRTRISQRYHCACWRILRWLLSTCGVIGADVIDRSRQWSWFYSCCFRDYCCICCCCVCFCVSQSRYGCHSDGFSSGCRHCYSWCRCCLIGSCICFCCSHRCRPHVIRFNGRWRRFHDCRSCFVCCCRCSCSCHWATGSPIWSCSFCRSAVLLQYCAPQTIMYKQIYNFIKVSSMSVRLENLPLQWNCLSHQTSIW